MNKTITIKQWVVILFTILFVGFCIFVALVFNWGPAQAEKQFIPCALHSVLIANYSEDPRGIVIPHIKESIILEVIRDLLGPGQELEAEAVAAIDKIKVFDPLAGLSTWR